MDALLTDDETKEETDEKDDYYHHESGPFSKTDGSYRHRNQLSPKHQPLNKNPNKNKIRHSFSLPNFSLYSNQPKRIRYSKNSIEYQYQHLLRDIIKADVPMFPKSSKLCPHKHHCLQNAIMKGFFRTFSAAYIFKTSLSFFTKLFIGKISLNSIKQIYLNPDSILFGLFVGLMSFTYKAILCILRIIRKKDAIYHKTIAGFISGLWIIIDDKTRRKQIALYCLVRSISDLIKLCVFYKQLPYIEHSDIAIFTFSQLFIMHGLVHASHALDSKYYQWIKNMGHLREKQCQLTFRSRINPALQYRLPSEKWNKCYPLFHSDHSCLRHNCIDWFYGLIRAAQIYLPVHFLPTILFEPKRILNEPISFIKRKTYNMIISSIFLSTYQFNMKITLCTLRNIFKSDDAWHGIVGGFFTGLPLLIENKYRRPELMLYCIPRAMEVAMRLIPKKK
eukprot:159790_1